jgi:pyruvate-formate lyase
MTRLCLEAYEGYRKPDLSLLVRDDMPQDLWDAALRTLGSGSGNPALKNDRLYISSLAAGRSQHGLERIPGGGSEALV